MRKTLAVLALLVAAILTQAAGRAQAPGAPRLLVILVIDQMRADYVDKYGHQWTRGLRRLVDEGAWFRTAAYPYMNTVTCAGHATIATGALPYAHGVILNDWWDRDAGRSVPCTQDPDFPYISYARPLRGGASPRFLRLPTLADELRSQSPIRPRVASLAMKDRSAIMMGGRRPDVVAWYNMTAGGLVTSSFYGPSPTPFVQDYTARHPVEADFGRTWTRAMPADRYLFDDDASGETPPAPWTASFPHVVQAFPGGKPQLPYELWRETPFEDAYLLGLVRATIDALRLGSGPGTDLLAVSFSALDHIGHDFGPWSHEVQDALFHLDGIVGELLGLLDRAAGRDGYVLSFTSDHGITPIPEVAARSGIESGYIAPAEVEAKAQAALAAALGPGKYVAKVTHTNVYFAPGVSAKLKEHPAALRSAIESIATLPGILRVVDGATLGLATAPSSPLLKAAALSYDPIRSGDLILMPRPYWVIKGEDITTHGTANAADARIPLILFGRGIKRGEHFQSASPADIAPTLAFLAGVTMSSPDGRILQEALAAPPSRESSRRAGGQ
ncbi:MAG: alkaline phosphatase family protein [Acidobacteria bacterium]|nr:alkaline phosphatase family protein [Acidobacteriota bacterium]MBI3262985.1 alkaline phosphatase family protein [Acidobacteriota bacterium]